jgi:hypothetical protein
MFSPRLSGTGGFAAGVAGVNAERNLGLVVTQTLLLADIGGPAAMAQRLGGTCGQVFGSPRGCTDAAVLVVPHG